MRQTKRRNSFLSMSRCKMKRAIAGGLKHQRESDEGALVEVASPEDIVLHDEGDNARLQLRHEGVVSGDSIYVLCPPLQIKILQDSNILFLVFLPSHL